MGCAELEAEGVFQGGTTDRSEAPKSKVTPGKGPWGLAARGHEQAFQGLGEWWGQPPNQRRVERGSWGSKVQETLLKQFGSGREEGREAAADEVAALLSGMF